MPRGRAWGTRPSSPEIRDTIVPSEGSSTRQNTACIPTCYSCDREGIVWPCEILVRGQNQNSVACGRVRTITLQVTTRVGRQGYGSPANLKSQKHPSSKTQRPQTLTEKNRDDAKRLPMLYVKALLHTHNTTTATTRRGLEGDDGTVQYSTVVHHTCIMKVLKSSPRSPIKTPVRRFNIKPVAP